MIMADFLWYSPLFLKSIIAPLQFILFAQYGRYSHSLETRAAVADPSLVVVVEASPVGRRVVVVGTAGPSLVGTATVAVVRAALGIAAAAGVEAMFPKSVPAMIEVVDSNPVVVVGEIAPSLAAVDSADSGGFAAASPAVATASFVGVVVPRLIELVVVGSSFVVAA